MVLDLDNVNRGILNVLQQDARNATAAEMGDAMGVSASTVRNRIERMEDAGVIRGYHPEIDYAEAGYQLHLFIVCRASPANRTEQAQHVLDLDGVIRVRELLTGESNLHVEAIAPDPDGTETLMAGLVDLGLDIASSDVVKADYVQPCNHFGSEQTQP